MRCQSISGLVRSGLTSTSFCTTAFEAKFSLIGALVHIATRLLVSILVLVERPFGRAGAGVSMMKRKVSILVLVERPFGPSKGTYTSFCRPVSRR